MTYDAYTVNLHILVCKACRTSASDEDADRLALWGIEHEAECIGVRV